MDELTTINNNNMKSKYKYRIASVSIFNRWRYKYPPENWTPLGFNIYWIDHELIRYSICLFGIELRFKIERKLIEL